MEKKRIGYIDAMRGFTMILVVYNHVLGFSFQSDPAFSFNDIFITFRMPLFFFLSGFLMYRPNLFRTGAGVGKFLKKKAMVQLVPTIIFTIAFCLIFRYSYHDLWFEKAKCGYWFTVTLFYFFALYALGDWTLGRFLRGRAKILAGTFAALLVYAFSKYSLSAGCPWANSAICGFVGFANLQYFIFFFIGALVKAHFDAFQDLLDRKGTAGCIVSGFVVLLFALLLPQSRDWIVSRLSFPFYSLLKSVAGLLGIFTVFACFRRNRYFMEHSRVGNWLQGIGTRTLDIYLIHLILIRTDLRFFGDFLSRHANPVTELFLVTAVSIVVIELCLLISDVLRSSDFVAKLLFGKVIKPTEEPVSKS